MRKATEADFDLVYETYFDDSVNPFTWYDPMDKNAFTKVFQDMLSRDYFWIIQNNNGDDCGMITAVSYNGRGSHIAEIQSFGIKKDYQNQGLGKKTLQGVINELKKDGFLRIQLGFESDNTRGLAFYKKLGFEQDGLLKKFLKRGPDEYVDEILMSIVF